MYILRKHVEYNKAEINKEVVVGSVALTGLAASGLPQLRLRLAYFSYFCQPPAEAGHSRLQSAASLWG
jgi:hypothetical protein